MRKISACFSFSAFPRGRRCLLTAHPRTAGSVPSPDLSSTRNCEPSGGSHKMRNLIRMVSRLGFDYITPHRIEQNARPHVSCRRASNPRQHQAGRTQI